MPPTSMAMNKLQLKKQIVEAVLATLDTKIETAKLAIETAKESRDNETKCSMAAWHLQTKAPIFFRLR